MKYLPKFMNTMFGNTQMQIIEDGEARVLEDSEWEEKEHDDDDDCHDDDHHHYQRMCSKPDVAVVGKIFEFCDESKKKLYKFEEAIREYYENYPYIIIKYEKIYPKHKKCTVRYCVWFSLLNFEKAIEVEKGLQRKFRYLVQHSHHGH